MPLRHSCEYAPDFLAASLTAHAHRRGSSLPQHRRPVRTTSSDIHQIWAGA
jgi:hypothetical protein